MKVTKWSCGVDCCQFHDTYEEAVACVVSQIEPWITFKCPVCGREDTNDISEQCCNLDRLKQKVKEYENCTELVGMRSLTYWQERLERAIKYQEGESKHVGSN